jgi:molecular chaperone DnaK (HSP70)
VLPATQKQDGDTRFVVGIDLGTTNIAVCYVDLEGESALEQFAIPQLVSAGEVGDRDLLPSFCYLPGAHELPEGALELPWSRELGHAVGVFGRDQGAAVPGRMVASAKSWLAHAGVDRTQGILPWGGDLGDSAVSPVDVSRYYLEHVRSAWDTRFGDVTDRHGTPCVLAEQQVVLTVPASFDEVARELTVRAARDAGIERLVLLEEPLAAFYSWLWQHEEDWRERLQEGETVLVVDVGGGTTDFSLITIEPGFTLRRTAVGEHLLLGGDNMDMSLARNVETAWGDGGLSARDWGMLCQACRCVKERLLAEDAPESDTVAISGGGSAVIAATRTQDLTRLAVVEAIRDGFFPVVSVDTAAPERRSGIRQMGLPYAADPAVTKHLLQFLRQAAHITGREPGSLVLPDHILYNGGAMLPSLLRERVAEVVGGWADGSAVPELAARDLNLAVSRGAAYYGLVRQGTGVRVRGGIARSFYLEVGRSTSSELVCVMPRDAEEGRRVELEEFTFKLAANQAVRFPLFSSATRLGDRPGELLADREEISNLPPLQTVLTFGKGKQMLLDVQISAELNEVGTLDLACATLDGQHRYPLSFDLRATDTDEASGRTDVMVDEAHLNTAREVLGAAFSEGQRLSQAMGDIESVLGMVRAEWGAQMLRAFADHLLELCDSRGKTSRHEARWLNMMGFLMRPGWGVPGDEWRMRELWKLWHSGPLAPRDAQVAAEWWVFWRRVAGGLRTGHQQQLASGLMRDLIPKPAGRLGPRKRGPQEAREMWRCLGAMERLSVKGKMKAIRALLMAKERLEGHHYWVVARLGARQLFYGPDNAVVPAEQLESVLSRLFDFAGDRGEGDRNVLFAVGALCRLCGVRALDVSSGARNRALTLLRAGDAPAEWQRQLETVTENSESYQAEVIGDSLPLGLTLVDREGLTT